MSGSPKRASLATRLALLFVIGSSFIMVGVGYSLYHALGMQLDAANLGEVTGKTEVIRHLLRGIDDEAKLRANLGRLHDVSVGHPNLRIGVRSGDGWLLAPGDPALDAGAARLAPSPSRPYVVYESGDRIWWVHRIAHRLASPQPRDIDVVLAVEVTGSRELLREHAAVAILVVIAGMLASAVLAWMVTRRGLAPLANLAERAEHVTAQKLGARLEVQEAPMEVASLADSINRMLERLEQSFRDLEQFSADIAHELRTPINNLLLQTQVTLSRSRPAADYQETLHTNLVELERLHRMISDMLFLARADRHLLQLARDEIDVAAEVASVGEYFEAAMADRGQRFVIEGNATLDADRSMLRRTLTNLVSNAVRYSPDGAAIRVEITQAPGETRIAIRNPCEAMAPAELRRLFTRFARRDESRGREVEGVGLGLAIVASIMELQGGMVEAASDGGLITFVLRFPREGRRLPAEA